MPGALLITLLLTWVQASSETFVVKSSAGEAPAKRVLQELERFRQLVGSTLVFDNIELPELPIEVLLIDDEATLRELEPEYNGRKVAVSGYYQAGQDRDFIVLSAQSESLTSVVYHELTHYFIARGLKSKPSWLNEGLAEYFSTAEIHDDTTSLGALLPDRLQALKTSPMLPLKEFFAIDPRSPHYNEVSKASIFYAQAWAFAHYMMHGEHAERFKSYLKALQRGEADLFRHVNISERELEISFQNYVKAATPRTARTVLNTPADTWEMEIEPIADSEAQIAIAEIFLANGRLQEAKRHLEILSAEAPESTRVSYYRGVLAQISGESTAREYFVDALLDPYLAPRAAAVLVSMGDTNIPAVRTILEEAVAMETRNAAVHAALAALRAEDQKNREEAARLKEAADLIPAPGRLEDPSSAEGAAWRTYLTGTAQGGKVAYELRSESDRRPQARSVTPPYYPLELLEAKTAGEVVMDIQVAADGRVAGVWLVSAMPDLFETLATSSVREWHFEPIPTKIRVIVRFIP